MSDLIILYCSTLFAKVGTGTWPKHKLELNRADMFIDWFYLVVDGNYLDYRIFIKTIQAPTTKRLWWYGRAQEAFKKGFVRRFGALYSWWHILANPSRLWKAKDMDQVVLARAITHNMIVECRDADVTMKTMSIVVMRRWSQSVRTPDSSTTMTLRII